MILVLGGTTEGRELALGITTNWVFVLAFSHYGVGSEDGQDDPGIRTQVGELDSDSLKNCYSGKRLGW